MRCIWLTKKNEHLEVFWKMVRKTFAFLLVLCIVFGSIDTFAEKTDNKENVWKEIYVSNDGSDLNSGTKDKPFKTIKRAKEFVREINDNMQGDIIVNILSGTYYLDEQLDFDNNDSGKNGYNVIYNGIDRPTISGGQPIGGFVKSADYPGVYEANVDGLDRIYQLYVNGKKRYMARSEYYVTGVKKPDEWNNSSWYASHPNDLRDDYNYYDPDTEYLYDGMFLSKKDFGMWDNLEDVMFVWDQYWKTQIIPCEEVMENPYDSSNVIVRMKHGLYNSMVWFNDVQDTYGTPTRPFRIVNAMELLDSSGEFYYNRGLKKLYYMPMPGEDMATATVIVPKLDRCMTVYGNDWDDTTKNITFKGLTIAHFSYNAIGDYILGEQLAGLIMSRVKVTPSAIEIIYGENINFYDNYFYGFGAGGISFAQGDYKCNVIGNAFSDINMSSVLIGRDHHSSKECPEDIGYPVPEKYENAQYNILNDRAFFDIKTSYFGDEYWGEGSYMSLFGRAKSDFTRERTTYISSKEDSVDENTTYNYKGGAWWGCEEDVAKGEKQWVMFDFMKKYSIDKIGLCWDSDIVKDNSTKADFEVLLSNDETFKDGSYIVAATQKGAVTGEVAEFDVSDNTKYRYMMIRTLGATQLSLSRAYALTSDRKPHSFYARVKEIEVSNNYITRTGGDIPYASSVGVYYGDDLKFLHNDISTVGYCGFNIGWGWSDTDTGTRNVQCSYNKISDTTLMMYDGGAIYQLSSQPNSVYEKNHIVNVLFGMNALYSDAGTADIMHRDNVFEITNHVYCPKERVVRNAYIDSYATGDFWNRNGQDDLSANVTEPLKIYTPGQPDAKAYIIIEEAGLESQYEYLKELVPQDVESGFPELIEQYKKIALSKYHNQDFGFLKKQAQNILEYGNFGDGLGMYPSEYKVSIEKELETFTESSSADEAARLREMLLKLKHSVKRYSLSETLDILRETIDNFRTISDNCPCINTYMNAANYDTFGMIKSSDADIYKEEYNKLLSESKDVSDKISEYTVLTKAENLYNKILDSTFKGEIISAKASGLVEYSIDKDNATVNLLFNANTSLNDVNLEINVSNDSAFATTVKSAVDLSTPMIVPIYCKTNKAYKYWTIKATYVNHENEDYKNANNWYSTRPDASNVFVNPDGTLTITQSSYETMCKSFDDEINGAEIKFTPVTFMGTKQFNFILGASSYNDCNIHLSSSNSDRLQVEFKNQTATMYTVSQGKKTLVKEFLSNINYNEDNVLKYSIISQGDGNLVTLMINGKVVFNEIVSKKLYSKYFGFQGNSSSIIIK